MTDAPSKKRKSPDATCMRAEKPNEKSIQRRPTKSAASALAGSLNAAEMTQWRRGDPQATALRQPMRANGTKMGRVWVRLRVTNRHARAPAHRVRHGLPGGYAVLQAS